MLLKADAFIGMSKLLLFKTWIKTRTRVCEIKPEYAPLSFGDMIPRGLQPRVILAPLSLKRILLFTSWPWNLLILLTRKEPKFAFS